LPFEHIFHACNTFNLEGVAAAAAFTEDVEAAVHLNAATETRKRSTKERIRKAESLAEDQEVAEAKTVAATDLDTFVAEATDLTRSPRSAGTRKTERKRSITTKIR
jgi:hypothetical protein